MPAPVALFVYNRLDHTRQTLNALGANTLALQTDLFVFSDGPKSENDVVAVRAVRQLVREVSGLASVTLVERETNMGLARSVIAGVSSLLEEHDSVIVLEDDLVTSKNFLTYMNRALANYRYDPNVFSVTGYTYPERYLRIPDDYPFDVCAGYRCSSWSWGTWRDRWQLIDWDMNYFASFSRDIRAQAAFNRGGRDMSMMLRMQYEGRIDSWAIRFCYAHFAHNMKCIYPRKTLVRNIGLDNTGTHSKPDLRFSHSSLDQAWLPRQFCPADRVDPWIARSFRSVFEPSDKPRVQAIISTIKNLAGSRTYRAWVLLNRLAQRIFRPAKNADILYVNSFQSLGGAARAAWRTFYGIRDIYPRAQYLTLVKDDYSTGVVGHYRWSVKGVFALTLALCDRFSILPYRRRLPGFFTPAAWSNPLSIKLSRFRTRLIHLHWIGFSLLRIEDLGRPRVPVVWTLHDAWAFTGGCHYTGNCNRFRAQCGSCPVLGSRRDNDLSRAIWRRKHDSYANMNLTVVTPSRWLANKARESSLLAGRRIEVIPYGLDTQVFRPIDKTVAKGYLDINPSHPVLLFGAHSLSEQRKGGDLLASVLANLDFPCTLLTFGGGELDLDARPNLTVHTLGSLQDDISLAMVYSAADMFLCPSREDNLPNTVLEAMACGTPCVAFAVGGLPEMITHRIDGWLADAFDVEDFTAGIRWLATNPRPSELRQASRDRVLARHSLETISSRYAALYAELLGQPPPRRPASK